MHQNCCCNIFCYLGVVENNCTVLWKIYLGQLISIFIKLIKFCSRCYKNIRILVFLLTHSVGQSVQPSKHRADCQSIIWKLLTLHKRNMLPNDNVSMSVGHLDHVLTVYSSVEHVTWKSPVSRWSGNHLYPGDQEITCIQVIFGSHAPSSCKQSRRDLTDIETLSLGNIFRLRRVRSFHIIVCTKWMNLFNTKIVCQFCKAVPHTKQTSVTGFPLNLRNDHNCSMIHDPCQMWQLGLLLCQF